MTEKTADKIERPSFDDAYNELTGLDDIAIRDHMGYDVEELYEGLNDGTLNNRRWLQLAECLEFVRIRKRPEVPDALAAQLVREMPRKETAGYLGAYMEATFGDLADEDEPDPESAEGKGEQLSEQPASPKPKSTRTSAERSEPASE